MSDDATPAKVRLTAGLGPATKAPRWWHCDTHGAGTLSAWGCPECVREMRGEIERMRVDAARAKGLIQRLAAEARQSGDLVRDPEALMLAAMYYGA